MAWVSEMSMKSITWSVKNIFNSSKWRYSPLAFQIAIINLLFIKFSYKQGYDIHHVGHLSN